MCVACLFSACVACSLPVRLVGGLRAGDAKEQPFGNGAKEASSNASVKCTSAQDQHRMQQIVQEQIDKDHSEDGVADDNGQSATWCTDESVIGP
jgi:hypothetical protein